MSILDCSRVSLTLETSSTGIHHLFGSSDYTSERSTFLFLFQFQFLFQFLFQFQFHFQFPDLIPFQILQDEFDPIDPTQFYFSVYGSRIPAGPILIILVGGSRTVPSRSVPTSGCHPTLLLPRDSSEEFQWRVVLRSYYRNVPCTCVSRLLLPRPLFDFFCCGFPYQIVGTDTTVITSVVGPIPGLGIHQFCDQKINWLVSLRGSSRHFLDLPRRPTLRTVRIRVLT